MKYILLLYAEEKALTEVYREKRYAESTQLCLDLAARGGSCRASIAAG